MKVARTFHTCVKLACFGYTRAVHLHRLHSLLSLTILIIRLFLIIHFPNSTENIKCPVICVVRRFRQLCGFIIVPTVDILHISNAFYQQQSEDGNINGDVGDVDDPRLVHFPVSDNKPLVLYQLIQKIAENFSSSTDKKSGKAEKISHCRNGHSLILFDDFHSKDVVEIESSERMICDGCVQPIQSPPDSFYGCLDCNFFLHTICATELPREFQHASHPQHKLVRCDDIRKPNIFFNCEFCDNTCNGMFYRCDSCKIYIDLVCTAMPTQIKHDAHKHKLEYSEHKFPYCDGCEWYSTGAFRCKICDYKIDARCVRKPGRIMHRWDEHQLCLMYPRVKGHPHDFNCEFCSKDINPNKWFYHCRKCDTSFHADCLDQCRFPNIKFGAIVQYPDLHQHSLKISVVERIYTCGICGVYRNPRLRGPILACVSCKFSVCNYCTRFVEDNRYDLV
ncbi:uncharacterized protein LOC141678779 isoform X2 [Apium graveolens]|uniref:uncharacterized protein LOC141678779 isoform X2 n=1 Tax=Apium graveolens TaxID=4045 RepID=UPI003D7BFEBD